MVPSRELAVQHEGAGEIFSRDRRAHGSGGFQFKAKADKVTSTQRVQLIRILGVVSTNIAQLGFLSLQIKVSACASG